MEGKPVLPESEVEAFAWAIQDINILDYARKQVRRIALRAAEVERERAAKIAENGRDYIQLRREIADTIRRGEGSE